MQLIVFIGMTVSLVFLFTRHISFQGLREKITEKRVQYDETDRRAYVNLFLYKFFTCDYCCGFWMGIVSLVSVKYCEPINYLFTGAIISYLLFNIKEL